MSIAVSLQYVIKKNDKFINVLKIKTNYVNQITYLVLQIYIIGSNTNDCNERRWMYKSVFF